VENYANFVKGILIVKRKITILWQCKNFLKAFGLIMMMNCWNQRCEIWYGGGLEALLHIVYEILCVSQHLRGMVMMQNLQIITDKFNTYKICTCMICSLQKKNKTTVIVLIDI
jgi:hypothetical protein